MKRLGIAIAGLGSLPFAPALADTSLLGANRVTGGLLLQSTSYKTKDTLTLEGQIVEAGYKMKVMPKLVVGGGLGLMFDGNVGSGINHPNGGNGLRLFGDAQYEVNRFDRNKVLLTSTLSYDRFNFSEVGVGASFNISELKLGSVILHYFPSAAVYGGAEFVGYSDGTFDFGELSTSIKRKSPFIVRFGGAYRLNKKISLTGDALLLGESTFLFAADYAF